MEASPRCHPYVGPVVVSIRRVRVAGVWHMLSCLQSVQLSPLMLTQAKYQNTTTQVQRQQRRAKNIEYLSTKHDCVPMSDMAELSLIGGSIVLYNIVNIIHMTWEHFHLFISPCIQY